MSEPSGPWSTPPERQAEPPPPRPRERMLNAPGVVILLIGLIGLGYLAQLFLLTPYGEAQLAWSGRAMAEGRWGAMLSHIFLHGGLFHLVMNGGALLAFGTPPARWLGGGVRGAVIYLLAFLVFGAAGALVFSLINPAGDIPMVGASGAICGLWAMTARLMGGRGYGLGGLTSPAVVSQTGSFVLMNLILVGAAFALSSGGQPMGIAWEAHVGGYLAGLLLAPVFGRLAGR